jgi:cobalt-zinc-cadmium efflux system protein
MGWSEHDHLHDHDLGHSHGGRGHSHAPAGFGRAFSLGIALNLAYVGAEAFYGLAADSLALLADAGHNLGDVLGLVLAWGAEALSRRRPTQRHTYGFRSTSILAAIVNAVVLLVVTGGIVWEAIRRLSDPQPSAGLTIIIVAAAGIAVNAATALLFMSGKGDLNIRGAFLHMASDALVAVGVVAAGAAILWTGWLWLDPATSIVVGMVIVAGTWGLLRDSVNLALAAVPAGVDRQAVEAYLAGLPGVTEVHDLHIWGMSTTETALTAHLVRPEGGPSDLLLLTTAHELEERFGICHATLQVETGADAQACRLAPAEVV